MATCASKLREDKFCSLYHALTLIELVSLNLAFRLVLGFSMGVTTNFVVL